MTVTFRKAPASRCPSGTVSNQEFKVWLARNDKLCRQIFFKRFSYNRIEVSALGFGE